MANQQEGEENIIDRYYKDEETYRLVNSVATVVGIPVDEVWESYGGFLIQFTMETGWDDLLRTLASDLRGFLDNLDSLHYFIDHVVYKVQLKGPSFRCESRPDGSLLLHYSSQRSGLYPIVKGVVREVARQIYNLEITMRVVERKMEMTTSKDGNSIGSDEHVTFEIVALTKPQALNHDRQSLTDLEEGKTAEKHAPLIQLTLSDFQANFPFHICFDNYLIMVHCGAYISRYRKRPEVQLRLDSLLELVHPRLAKMTFQNFLHHINGTFVLRLQAVGSNPEIMLKGQMVLIQDGTRMIYLASPYVTTIRELLDKQLYLGDIPLHDATRDLVLLNQSRMSQLELNEELQITTKKLKSMHAQLEQEKERTDTLLKELLPQSVAEKLRQGKQVDAGEYPNVSVLFADIVGFTSICSHSSPIQIVTLLNDLYLLYDRLTNLHEVYKVETIGDAYMVACGVPEQCNNHAEKVCDMALGMLWECRSVKAPSDKEPITVRIGIHSGSVLAGIVGKKMPRYCLFGDCVNTASRMESHSTPMKIHCSEAFCNSLVEARNYVFEERGVINIKGKGAMRTYFLIRNNRRSVWELIARERSKSSTIDGYEELHDPNRGVARLKSIVGLPTENGSSPLLRPSVEGDGPTELDYLNGAAAACNGTTENLSASQSTRSTSGCRSPRSAGEELIKRYMASESRDPNIQGAKSCTLL